MSKLDRVPVIVGTYCCGFVSKHAPTTVEYHRHHKAFHLIRFPKTDAATLQSLDALIAKHTPKSAAEMPS